MHSFDEKTSTSEQHLYDGQPWYRGLTGYHWFVLAVAALGWLFDTMDQQLFLLARMPAVTELMNMSPSDPDLQFYGGIATMIFMFGWATGGICFGVLGDRIGRAKTMLITILMYSVFTGLSALSVSIWDFAFYRFLTGLGVGGEFAVGVALVAEVMPDRARTHALGWLQALSAVGNMTAALINIGLGMNPEVVETTGVSAWRLMFVIGAVPALLAIVIRWWLREPERWKAAVSEEEGDSKRIGSYGELFGDPRWRKNAIIGLLLSAPGIIGLWGIGFYSFELVRMVFRQTFEAQGLTAAEVNAKLTYWVGIMSLVQNLGAFFGIYSFSKITNYLGRRPTFALAFAMALLSTAMTFWFLNSFADVFWMIPLMGFFQLSLFGGYAIYFPELFPTRLRSTGISFCYNVGRYVAAVGPLTIGLLASRVYHHHESVEAGLSLRYAGVTMCSFFLLGLLVLPFAPETKGKPLPE
ncbi:MAG: MFS transporter [Gemmataceae bacterium]